MAPSEMVEQCTCRVRVGFNERGRRLLQGKTSALSCNTFFILIFISTVSYVMTPASMEYEYFSKLLDALGVALEQVMNQ